jgi:hypothetical protein
MLLETKLCLKILNVLFYRANSFKALVLINRVVGHPALRILRKCENEIYVFAPIVIFSFSYQHTRWGGGILVIAAATFATRSPQRVC